jgi:hypothetical protein
MTTTNPKHILKYNEQIYSYLYIVLRRDDKFSREMNFETIPHFYIYIYGAVFSTILAG